MRPPFVMDLRQLSLRVRWWQLYMICSSVTDRCEFAMSVEKGIELWISCRVGAIPINGEGGLCRTAEYRDCCG
ncbi:hypothetical protein V6N13_094085 [Hibiscus sabdariffa]